MTTFAEVRPDLAKYYKPEFNDGKLMSEFSSRSNKKIVLCCDVCGTLKSNTNPNNLIRGDTFTCFYCNSLAINFFELSEEWNFEKNENLTPFEVAWGSRKRVWWKCKKGHEWEANIAHRTNSTLKRNCPNCNMSKGEKIIEEWLIKNHIEYTAQRPAKIGDRRKLFDFYLSEENIFVEIHGAQHFGGTGYFNRNLKKRQEIDEQKREYAENNGIYIMVDYREHNPKLALERFIDALAELP